MFFSPDSALQVRHRQHDEDKGLQQSTKDAEAHHRPGHDERKDPEEDSARRVLAEDVTKQPDSQ